MALMIIKNGDVYSAEKTRIIGEIIVQNIWKNKFLEHIQKIEGVGSKFGSNIQSTHLHIDQYYRQSNAPLTYDFLFNFLGLDYNQVDKLWRNDAVEHMHFGIRGGASNFVQKDYAASRPTAYIASENTLATLQTDVSIALSKLNTDISSVNKITCSLVYGRSYSVDTIYTTEAAAISALNSITPHIPMSACKGFNTSNYNVWKTSYRPTETNNVVLANYNNKYPNGIQIRLFNGTTELYKGMLQPEVYAELVRLTNTLEGTATSSSYIDNTIDIQTTFTSIKISTIITRKWGASGRAETTHTFNAASFATVLSQTSTVYNLLKNDWATNRADGYSCGSNSNRGYGIDCDWRTSYQAKDIAAMFQQYTLNEVIKDWLVPTNDLEYTGYYINLDRYRKTNAKEIISVLSLLIDIWIEEDDGGFWGSFVGKLISFVFTAVLIIGAIVFTIITGGAGAPIASVALAAGAVLMSMTGNMMFTKMLMVSSAAVGLAGAGATPVGGAGYWTQGATAGKLGSAISITKNLSSAFNGLNNLAAAVGFNKESIPDSVPEDNAETQDEINQYMFTSGYDTYGSIYHDYDEEYRYDKYFA